MTATLAPAIAAQLEALCAAIAADPDVKTARENAEAFLEDEQGVALYRDMVTMGRSLEQQHRSGVEIEDADIARFQSLQTKSEEHEGIRSFTAAQEVLQEVANHVNGFVAKTLEKGRVPSAEEVFGSGGCGSGCGCH